MVKHNIIWLQTYEENEYGNHGIHDGNFQAEYLYLSDYPFNSTIIPNYD